MRMMMTQLARRIIGGNPTPGRRLFVRNTLRKWCIDRELPVDTRWGFKMLANPHDYASYGIYFFGEYDEKMSAIVRRYVRSGQTAWDIGTDRGWFTLLLAAQVGPAGRVDSFEAFPDNARRLNANVELNAMKQVRVHGMAVSDRRGEIFFEPPSDAATGGADYLEDCSGAGFITAAPSARSLRVRTIGLDEFADAHPPRRLDFIKMDIEGAEVKALRGARRVVERFKPMIAVEYNRATLLRAGASMAELDGLLDEMGYHRLAWRAGGFRPVDLRECEGKSDGQAVFNAYCFHRAGSIPCPI